MAMSGVAAAQPRRSYNRLLNANVPALALLCVFVFAGIRYPAFLSSENLLNILRQNSMLGLLSVAMTFVIVSGGIDLSVGSLVAVGAVTAAELSYHGTLAGVTGALLAGGLLGLLNGALIAKVRLQPFIVTLAMMIAARGMVLLVTHEQSVPVAKSAATLTFLGRGRFGPLPVPVLLLLACFALAALVLRYTGFGQHVYAIGDDEEAAQLLGLHVPRVEIGVYTLSGVLAGAAGLLLAARLGAGQPVAGSGWELDAIAAVVVGGTLLTGGQGGVGSTFIGLVLLASLLNAFNLEGTISSWWQGVLRGVLLLLFVTFQGGRKGPAD
jgi:ribose/xylose/arabinose/galactoside ABC-type transport system permease subunit